MHGCMWLFSLLITISATVRSSFGSTLLKMASSKLKAPQHTVVEKDFNVVKDSGFVLKGKLTLREGQPESGPILVFLHGTMSYADHNYVPDLANKLAKDFGIRSYRFDFRFGQCDFEPTHRYKFSGYADDVDDLDIVIKVLSSEGYQVWGLVGHSRCNEKPN